MLAALSVFKLSVQNVHQLQQHTIEVVPYQWTPMAIPYRYQGSLQLGNVGRFWRAFLIASQHRAPHMIIQWRIRWPFVFSNETRAFLLDPVLGKSCCVSICAILLKDEVVRQEMPAVFDIRFGSSLVTYSNWRSLWPFRPQREVVCKT